MANGVAHYSIPIDVAPGRGGMQPQLSLHFSGEAGNGVMGIGWNLGGLSVISRCQATLDQDGFWGGVNFDADDRYCLDGQRLVPINGDHGEVGAEYRTEIDSFAQIISYGGEDYNPEYWVVKTKSGRVMTYGGSNASQLFPKGTVTWSLREQNDTTGNNPITYAYTDNRGTQYLNQVDYPSGSISFVYEERPDVTTAYAYGQQVSMSRRVSQIDIQGLIEGYFSGPVAARPLQSYRLTYHEAGEVDRYSRIKAITACDPQNNCLRDTKFTWSSAGNANAFQREYHKTIRIGDYDPFYLQGVHDVNGDGIGDILMAKNSSRGIWVRAALGTRDSVSNNYVTSKPASGNYATSRWSTPRVADVNNDGLADLVWLSTHTEGLRVGVSLSNGDRSFGSLRTQARASVSGTTWKSAGLEDINGDGNLDAVWHSGDASVKKIAVRLGLGNGQFDSLRQTTVSPGGNYSDWKFAGFHDTNRDGWSDMVWRHATRNTIAVSLAQGDNTYGELIESQVNPHNWSHSGWNFVGVGDSNGDGLEDLIWRYDGSAGLHTRVSLSQGNGSYGAFISTTLSTNSAWGDNRVGFKGLEDINGDGLSDLVWSRRSSGRAHTQVSLAKGDGTYRPTVFSRDAALNSSRTVVFAGFHDINSDGLLDMVWEHRPYDDDENHYLDKRGRLSASFARANGTYAAARSLGLKGDLNRWSHFYGVQDANNDGIGDIIWQQNNTRKSRRVAINFSRGAISRLTGITDAQDKGIGINYNPLSNPAVYTKGSDAAFPLVDQIGPQRVVSSVNEYNGIDANGHRFVKKTMYHYEGLKAHLQGRGSYGYAKVTESYVEGFYGSSSSSMRVYKSRYLNFDQRDFPWTGRILGEEERYRPQSEYVRTSRKAFTHEVKETHPGVYQINRTREDHMSYEPGQSQWFQRQVVMRRDIDNFGNVGRMDVINTANNETFSKITLNEYANNEVQWHIGQLQRSRVIFRSPYADDEERITAHTYHPNTGLRQTTSIVGANSGENLRITVLTHDDYGHVVRQQVGVPNVGERTTTRSYNAVGRMTSQCNALDECTTYTYNTRGQVSEKTDPDGLYTIWDYDGFGRQTQEARSDGVSTHTQRRLAGSGECGALMPGAYHCQITRISGSQPVTTQYDRLNRPLRTIKVGFDGRKIFNDTEYNARSLVSRVSHDYYEGDHKTWISTEYDTMERTIRVSRPGPQGTRVDTTTEYDGLVTTVGRGPDALTTTTTHNALGQKVRVEEEEGSTIDYTYNSDGNLLTTRVNSDPDTTITLSYDEYGRKVAMDDPDMGLWQYAYNGFDELIRQTDAKGQVSRMEYDSLGRLVRRVEPEGSSTWTYGGLDAAEGSVGKLLQEKTRGITKDYGYDSKGRQVSVTTRITDAGSFTTRTTYDEFSRPVRTVYPGQHRFSTTNVYNGNGFLSAVKGFRYAAETHNYDQLAPLVSAAVALADDYAAKAQALRELGEKYEHLKTAYRQLQDPGTLTADLVAHQSMLQSEIAKGQPRGIHTEERTVAEGAVSLPGGAVIPFNRTETLRTVDLDPEFMGHLNNAIAELETVTALINTQVSDYVSIMEQLTVLAEQTLAAADNNFAIATALTASAEIYGDYQSEQDRYTITYWRAADVDAAGRISAEVYGNGIVNDYAYNQGSGQLESIHSSLISINAVRHLEYEYDAYDNVTLRHDMINDIHEEFDYDRLERLTSSTVTSALYNTTTDLNTTQSLTYDVYGNITSKSDVGVYIYGQNGAGIHAVTRAGNNTYLYDANGNMTSGAGRSIEWSSFNKPTRITQNGRSVTFSYGADRARYKKVNHLGDITLYLGLVEKLDKANGDTEEKHYIYAAGQLVAERIVSSTDGTQTRYLHKDAMGSVDLITDTYANVVDRRSFDAWGKLRDFPWKSTATLEDPLYLTQLPYTNKGYTGHENVQEVNLIHMNGRMYDATLARFISADVIIQEPRASQSYNRYSYVWNNPMKYTDPTGHITETRVGRAISRAWNNFKKAVKRTWDKIKRAVRGDRRRSGGSGGSGHANQAGATAVDITISTRGRAVTPVGSRNIFTYLFEPYTWEYAIEQEDSVFMHQLRGNSKEAYRRAIMWGNYRLYMRDQGGYVGFTGGAAGAGLVQYGKGTGVFIGRERDGTYAVYTTNETNLSISIELGANMSWGTAISRLPLERAIGEVTTVSVGVDIKPGVGVGAVGTAAFNETKDGALELAEAGGGLSAGIGLAPPVSATVGLNRTELDERYVIKEGNPFRW
ncbi:FG-GAP-like repeat-containing protein [Exilibacterium tricleocarpae]|uniref:FG-GAP-like repeat-containing protein n=1 Tax=Exilibacterium tricleocarpae TaxID=2591008 RepID=UPI0015D20EA5|nr:FG-GAP-like repeat-containing protein [Exilibacterium tricleocarpae]